MNLTEESSDLTTVFIKNEPLDEPIGTELVTTEDNSDCPLSDCETKFFPEKKEETFEDPPSSNKEPTEDEEEKQTRAIRKRRVIEVPTPMFQAPKKRRSVKASLASAVAVTTDYSRLSFDLHDATMDNNETLLTSKEGKKRPGPDKEKHPARSHFVYNKADNSSLCLLESCTHSQPGDKVGNLMRHLYYSHHSLYLVVKQQRDEQIKQRSEAVQRSIDESKCISVKMGAELMKDACAELVSVNARPFAIVEDSAFRRFMQPLIDALPADERFVLSAETVKGFVRLKAEKLRLKIKEELQNKVISMKIDRISWLNRCFLGFNARYIENSKVCVRTLGVPELTTTQVTVENLRKVIVDILKKYSIETKKIYSLTSDNGSNTMKVAVLQKEVLVGAKMKNSIVEIKFEVPLDMNLDFQLEGKNGETHSLTSVPCVAHVLQSAVEDFLALIDIKDLLDKVRKLVQKLIEQDNVAELKRQNLLLPVSDISNHWYSMHDMLHSVLQIKHAAIQLCPNILDSEDWDLVKKLADALMPAKTAAEVFEKEQLLAGNFLGQWIRMKGAVKRQSSDFAKQFLKVIEEREGTTNVGRQNGNTLFGNEAFLAAVLLDPRFFTLLTNVNVNGGVPALRVAEQSLRKLFTKMSDEPELIDIGDTESEDEDEEEPDELELQLRELDRQRSVPPKLASDMMVRLNDELIDYEAKVQRLDKKTNILEWWQYTGVRKWPILSSLSKVALAVPVTQVSAGDLFSAVEFAYLKNGSGLSPELLENILFIRANAILDEKIPAETLPSKNGGNNNGSGSSSSNTNGKQSSGSNSLSVTSPLSTPLTPKT